MTVYIGLQIGGFQNSYNIGDNLTLTCSTDLSFSQITWLVSDDVGTTILSSETSEPELTVSLFSITEAVKGAEFTCKIESGFGVQTETFEIVINGGGLNLTVVGAVLGFCVVLVLLLLVVMFLFIYCVAKYRRNSKKYVIMAACMHEAMAYNNHPYRQALSDEPRRSPKG